MPRPKMKKLLINIAPNIAQELDEIAKQSGRTKGDIIREAIFLYIQAWRVHEAVTKAKKGESDF